MSLFKYGNELNDNLNPFILFEYGQTEGEIQKDL